MILLSAKSIAIKMDQDRVWFSDKNILICDGIGSFKDSGKAADIVIEHLKPASNNQELKSYIVMAQDEIVIKQIVGGTTLLSAIVTADESKLMLAYLGNGSIYHFSGDLFDKPDSFLELNKVHRYSNYLIPHVDRDGALYKHISPNSNEREIDPSILEISLNGLHGDVIIMFTDGVSSLEEELVITDDQSRLWRNQSENVNFILEHWNKWMKNNFSTVTQDEIDKFLEDELVWLKTNQKLDDDASIGLIITTKVFDYYKSMNNAN